MHPYIHLYGKVIPSYGLCAVSGFVAALIVIKALSRPRRLNVEDGIYIFTLGALGAVAGAKLLYVVLSLPQIISDLPLLKADAGLFFTKYISGGLVLYGGIAGGIAAAYYTAKGYGDSLTEYSAVLLPAMAVMQSLGRVGCFMAGCCYGRNGIPVQLIEAGFDIMLAVFFAVKGKNCAFRRCAAARYVIYYASFRFVIEFFRGDAIRGHIGVLSTSQWISIVAIIASAFVIMHGRILNNVRED